MFSTSAERPLVRGWLKDGDIVYDGICRGGCPRCGQEAPLPVCPACGQARRYEFYRAKYVRDENWNFDRWITQHERCWLRCTNDGYDFEGFVCPHCGFEWAVHTHLFWTQAARPVWTPLEYLRRLLRGGIP